MKLESLTFSDFIYNENYFLTTFDLWLLVHKYEIPTLFISPQNILQTDYESRVLLAYGDKEDDFAFIMIPGFRNENIPKFKVIESNTKEVFISLRNILNNDCTKIITDAFDNFKTIEDFLIQFTKKKTTTYQKKKPKKLIIETDESQEDKNVKVKSKKKIIIEESKSLTPVSEEFIIQPTKKSRKKKLEIKGNQTKKIRKKLIIEKDSNDLEAKI